jgi:hypothetical protein
VQDELTAYGADGANQLNDKEIGPRDPDFGSVTGPV